MLPVLQNLDSITFLNIDTTQLAPNELNDLRTELNNKIGEYLMLRLTQGLSWADQEIVLKETSPEGLIKVLSEKIPNLEQKIQETLEKFKSEYLKES